MLAGALDVLVPLRLDALGASGVAVGRCVLLLAAAIEALRSARRSGRFSDRRGRMTPIRAGLVASAFAALLLPLPARPSCCSPSCCVVAVLAMSLIWTPAMALLSDNAETAGLDLAFATALVSLAWAGRPGGRRLGLVRRSPRPAPTRSPTRVIAALFGVTLALLAVLRRSRRPTPRRRPPVRLAVYDHPSGRAPDVEE